MDVMLLDIKIIIASNNQQSWTQLMLIDDEFRQFAYSTYGRRLFIELFTEITLNSEKTEYRLFGPTFFDQFNKLKNINRTIIQ